jgi:hypothetical protein
MMNDQEELWKHLSGSFRTFNLALRAFFADDVDRVGLLKKALLGPHRAVALYLLEHLPQSELAQLFSELVFLASFSHGAVGAIRKYILSLPREWVITNIEQFVEPLLEQGTYDEYRNVLALYWELDHEMMIRLAQRAIMHSDPDIREAGEDYLSKPPNSISE